MNAPQITPMSNTVPEEPPYRFWVMVCIVCGKSYEKYPYWHAHIHKHIAAGVPSTPTLWCPPAFPVGHPWR